MTSAYFYCAPPDDASDVLYQHLLVCLAEGLQTLGLACYSNIDHWPLDAARTQYLLRHDPSVGPDDCSLVIVSDEWCTRGEALPERPQHRNACWIALDREDGSRLRTLGPAFRQFDLILRTHYNTHTSYGSNTVPWAYGLSERMIDVTRAAKADGRRWELLANWRHTSHPHSLRLAVERTFLPFVQDALPIDGARERHDTSPDDPRDRMWWYETGRRHWPAYYDRLMTGAACACFGGYFVTKYPAAKESLVSRTLKRMLTATHMQTHLISQWDSWRLWESFVAGSAAVHVDFDRYGCVLPEKPVNWKHYIGVDLDRPRATIERIRDEPAIVTRIGAAGRAWALENYSPPATARRLLDTIGIAPANAYARATAGAVT